MWRTRDAAGHEPRREAIVAELNSTGGTVSAVARKHNLAASLLFRWRREFGAKNAAGKAEAVRSFVPVTLRTPIAEPGPPYGSVASGAIEIVPVNGCRVIVTADVDVSALMRVIQALEQR